MKTDIRVDVRFKDPAIYAGEDLACIITFRNVAKPPQPYRRSSSGVANTLSRPKLVTQRSLPRPVSTSTKGTRPSIGSLYSPVDEKSHTRRQSTLSVSVGPNIFAHARSKSSVSAAVNNVLVTPTSASTSQHERTFSSSSLQGDTLSPVSPSFPSSRRPSKLFRQHSANRVSTFQIDQDVPVSPSYRPGKHGPLSRPTSSQRANAQAIDRPAADDINKPSPRPSTDTLALSDHSQDTLVSEPPTPVVRRLSFRKVSQSSHVADGPTLAPVHEPEHLMMAYVQTLGSFSLDGSLIDQAPFEQVKQQEVLTDGGVIGIEGQKPSNNFFDTFGWSGLKDMALSNVLAKDEKSSMKDLRSGTDQRALPLLSTPQSLLFVDLKLAPGEQKSCAYTFRVPRGLPPSHKGRAIKVNYSLKLGVQRPGEVKGRAQTSTVDIPFRVLGSVNDEGDSLGHDLSAPHVLLQDLALTADLLGTSKNKDEFLSTRPILRTDRKSFNTSLANFMSYTDTLLNRRTASDPLISPSVSRKQSLQPQIYQISMQDRIDAAISRSNISHNLSPSSPPDTKDAPQATNRFVIVKDDRHIGNISLLRPSYRLGETIVGKINFAPPAPAPSDPNKTSNSAPLDYSNDSINAPTTSSPASRMQKTYIVTTTLETTETIDPTLALRSSSSIQRATRKTFASTTCAALFARQVAFDLEIPCSATPGFETSGVNLEWRLRVAFTTEVPSAAGPGRGETRRELLVAAMDGEDGGNENEGSEDDESSVERDGDEKELVEGETKVQPGGKDGSSRARVRQRASDQGLEKALVAQDVLEAESFEVVIPLRVYGVITPGGLEQSGNGTLSMNLEI